MFKKPTGRTFSDFASLQPDRVTHPAGIPLVKPPYSHITAIDMKTGEHVWQLPVGETPDRYRENPALEGVDIGETGSGRHAPMMATKTAFIYGGDLSDGTPALFFVDKATGETAGYVELDGRVNYGMSTFVHEGKQYILLQTGPKLTALALGDF